MSFNIRYGDAPDGGNSWSNRRDASIKAIQSFGPHILAVQEALKLQNEDLLEALPQFGRVGVGRDDGVDAGEFASVFYDRSRLDLVDSGTFWFSNRPEEPGSRHHDCYHPRICTWATFEGGFAICNLHLDNVSSGSRMMAIEQLLRFIPPGLNTIVSGDFNAGEADPCIEMLRSAGYRDSYRDVHPSEPNVGTYHGFKSNPEPDKIDYIWIKPSWRVLEAEILKEQVDGRWPSDHYPVTAVLEMSN
jgi:endonuclease/exonuclease/phosphatase family metal-dependent hydrolase